MQDIEKSSAKIGEIIGIIQDIAFQTNILALNAAVEAARAGDAGRGFSVVANEVRALSQRTAQASKDIRLLINTSAGDVRKGVELSVNTASRLEDILGRVRPVADSAMEIASASHEQSAGIRQVASTIGSMEQITQRNAELVDHTTKSLAAARARIADLKKAISFFKSGNEQSEFIREVA
jgi:methyl-accepting chemotaxis protein